jgi:flagellar L-ring protein precursor FlgH
MRFKIIALRRTVVLALLGVCSVFASGQKSPKTHGKSPEQLRVDYIARLQEHYVPEADERTVGSLWTVQGPLVGFAVDYKAYHVNDTITIQIAVQTTAAQSGTVDSERTFTTNSAITGIMGRTPAATNPLLSANSSSALKGQGSTASNTLFATSLTGQVISVLPNGNLVVEAGRQIFMNNQHENVIVRGMVRPGDIGPNNTVSSTSLSNLEIEMKGKGIISDGVRPLNPISRAILWLLNF